MLPVLKVVTMVSWNPSETGHKNAIKGASFGKLTKMRTIITFLGSVKRDLVSLCYVTYALLLLMEDGGNQSKEIRF